MTDPLVDLANSLRPILDQYWQLILVIIFLAGAYAAYQARGRPSKLKPRPEIQDKPPTPPAPAPRSTHDMKADGCIIFQDYLDLNLKVPIRVELPAGWSEENYRNLIRPHLLEAMRSVPSGEKMEDVAELQDIDYAQLEADLNGAQPTHPQEPPPPAPAPSTQTDEKKELDVGELWKMLLGGAEH